MVSFCSMRICSQKHTNWTIQILKIKLNSVVSINFSSIFKEGTRILITENFVDGSKNWAFGRVKPSGNSTVGNDKFSLKLIIIFVQTKDVIQIVCTKSIKYFFPEVWHFCEICQTFSKNWIVFSVRKYFCLHYKLRKHSWRGSTLPKASRPAC